MRLAKNSFKSFILFISLIVLLSGCKKEDSSSKKTPQQAVVKLCEAQLQDVEKLLEFSGVTEASRVVQIRSRVEGYLQTRDYTEGSFVKKGDTLFTIDPSTFKIALAGAEAKVNQERVKLSNLKDIYVRTKELWEQNAISKQDYDAALSAYDMQKAVVDGALSSLEQAKLNLDYTVIKAPISGFVDKTLQNEGVYINSQQNSLLTSIYVSDPLYVNFSVPQNLFLSLREALESKKISSDISNGINADVITSNGKIIKNIATISFLSPTIDQATNSRTLRAWIQNKQFSLTPGEFVKIRLKGIKWDEAVVIPQNSIMQGAMGSFVYMMDKDSKAVQKKIEVGEWVGEKAIVSNGLKLGEKFICEGNARVMPGMSVKIASNDENKTK
jgi:membrane fusion protein (multidrug efflux system)